MAGQWIPAEWYVACLAGTVPAAYALRGMRRAELGRSVRWIAIASVIGIALIGAALAVALAASGGSLRPTAMLSTAASSFLLYIPVQFCSRRSRSAACSTRTSRARPPGRGRPR